MGGRAVLVGWAWRRVLYWLLESGRWLILDEVGLDRRNRVRFLGDFLGRIDEEPLIALGGGLNLANRLVEGLTQFGLSVTRHPLELAVKTTCLSQDTWKFLWSENHQAKDQQEDDLTAREVEHVVILRPVSDERYARAMQQSLPRLFSRPILFAHRGANLVYPENSLPAFSEAVRLGATGLETDVWLSLDGLVIIDHDGVIRSGVRKRPIRRFHSSELPSQLPTFESLLNQTPALIDISVDVKDRDAFQNLAMLVRHIEREPKSVWVCHPDLEVLRSWVEEDSRFSFVHSTRLRVIQEFPEKHARGLRELNIRVCNMHWRDWSGGLVALFHRFEIACFAWGLTHETEIREMLRIGIDGLYADDVSLLVKVAT